MSGQQQLEHGFAQEEAVGWPNDISKWCLRCAELRVRFHGAACLGRPAEAHELNAEFVRHQQVVHS
ncbi:hypothetical protein FGW37_22930 [Streptomyces rectiverticillatus]|uniref:hypothetical protein n=1 Tax=Streptomyces rectiverticillatus TaxID=173860 RepID=UPI0015C40574|nr:hypothetical protein [Streptomyces rectiverticillatus]QLE74059.1 hypothetical protein FGW37_22930 [Streptomyces rectiverticillatus]